MDENFVGRQWGAVEPDSVGRLKVGHKLDAVAFQRLFERFVGFDREQHSVDAHGLSGAQASGDILVDRRSGGQHLLHQLNACPFELFGGLEEVARIGPEQGMVHSCHESAGRAVESAEKFAQMPVVGHVLALVGVDMRYYDHVDMFFSHFVAQSADAFQYKVAHNY